MPCTCECKETRPFQRDDDDCTELQYGKECVCFYGKRLGSGGNRTDQSSPNNVGLECEAEGKEGDSS
ncbi:hypothetical protein ATANTOWER_008671 [Ataeniobius toweri]|uniref:Uncharacterized protein n=1 Tax=Ataeniobius toweri TaxID=208326 RepID=A0ABU7A5K8_9TELE|nr:hypothetical protein [Ataeniobius toweri]